MGCTCLLWYTLLFITVFQIPYDVVNVLLSCISLDSAFNRGLYSVTQEMIFKSLRCQAYKLNKLNYICGVSEALYLKK